MSTVDAAAAAVAATIADCDEIRRDENKMSSECPRLGINRITSTIKSNTERNRNGESDEIEDADAGYTECCRQDEVEHEPESSNKKGNAGDQAHTKQLEDLHSSGKHVTLRTFSQKDYISMDVMVPFDAVIDTSPGSAGDGRSHAVSSGGSRRYDGEVEAQNPSSVVGGEPEKRNRREEGNELGIGERKRKRSIEKRLPVYHDEDEREEEDRELWNSLMQNGYDTTRGVICVTHPCNVSVPKDENGNANLSAFFSAQTSSEGNGGASIGQNIGRNGNVDSVPLNSSGGMPLFRTNSGWKLSIIDGRRRVAIIHALAELSLSSQRSYDPSKGIASRREDATGDISDVACGTVVDIKRRKDNRNGRSSVSCENDVAWARKPLKMSWVMRKDGKEISVWEQMVMGTRANAMSGVVRNHNKSWLSIIQSILRFAPAFEQQYNVSFDKVCVSDLATELRSLYLLRAQHVGTYYRYARVAQMLLRFRYLYKELVEGERIWRLEPINMLKENIGSERFATDAERRRWIRRQNERRALGTSCAMGHLDDRRLRTSTEEDAMVMFFCVRSNVRTDQEVTGQTRRRETGVREEYGARREERQDRPTFNGKQYFAALVEVLNVLHKVHISLQKSAETSTDGGRSVVADDRLVFFGRFLSVEVSVPEIETKGRWEGWYGRKSILQHLAFVSNIHYRPLRDIAKEETMAMADFLRHCIRRHFGTDMNAGCVRNDVIEVSGHGGRRAERYRGGEMSRLRYDNSETAFVCGEDSLKGVQRQHQSPQSPRHKDKLVAERAIGQPREEHLLPPCSLRLRLRKMTTSKTMRKKRCSEDISAGVSKELRSELGQQEKWDEENSREGETDDDHIDRDGVGNERSPRMQSIDGGLPLLLRLRPSETEGETRNMRPDVLRDVDKVACVDVVGEGDIINCHDEYGSNDEDEGAGQLRLKPQLRRHDRDGGTTGKAKGTGGAYHVHGVALGGKDGKCVLVEEEEDVEMELGKTRASSEPETKEDRRYRGSMLWVSTTSPESSYSCGNDVQESHGTSPFRPFEDEVQQGIPPGGWELPSPPQIACMSLLEGDLDPTSPQVGKRCTRKAVGRVISSCDGSIRNESSSGKSPAEELMLCYLCCDAVWRPWLCAGVAYLKVQRGPRPFLDKCVLRSMHIPTQHRARHYINDAFIDFLRVLAWRGAAKAMSKELEVVLSDEVQLENVDEHDSDVHLSKTYACAFAYFVGKGAILRGKGYSVMEGMADYISFVPKSKRDEEVSGERNEGNVSEENRRRKEKPLRSCRCSMCCPRIPSGFPMTKVDELFKWVYESFPGERKMREGNGGEWWNPIVNTGYVGEDYRERTAGRARYSTTMAFMGKGMEHEDVWWPAQRRALLDVWVGMISAMMDLSERSKYRLFVPDSGGRFLLTGRGAVAQCGHNDFEVRRDVCPGYFVIATASEAAEIYVCPGSHHFVFYPKKERVRLAELLKLERVEIPPYSLFFGHGYVQHAGAQWKGKHSLRYHIYLVPEAYNLPDQIHFGYDSSLKVASEALM